MSVLLLLVSAIQCHVTFGTGPLIGATPGARPWSFPHSGLMQEPSLQPPLGRDEGTSR